MAFLPYVFAAYLGTVGTVYSPSFNINGVAFRSGVASFNLHGNRNICRLHYTKTNLQKD